MKHTIRFFGGTIRGEVAIGHEHLETRMLDRDVWFDQDFDGRWLVWVTAHDGTGSTDGEDDRTGAIVVRNRDAIAFIELLGRLFADPARFRHEPVFTGADDDIVADQSRSGE